MKDEMRQGSEADGATALFLSVVTKDRSDRTKDRGDPTNPYITVYAAAPGSEPTKARSDGARVVHATELTFPGMGFRAQAEIKCYKHRDGRSLPRLGLSAALKKLQYTTTYEHRFWSQLITGYPYERGTNATQATNESSPQTTAGPELPASVAMFQAGISLRFKPIGSTDDHEEYIYEEHSSRMLSASEVLAGVGSLLAFSAGLFVVCWSKSKDTASKGAPGKPPAYSCVCLPCV
jgi:hypothetical protein